MGDPRALRIEQLSVEFGGLRAVDGLSLEVGGGAFVGIVGPNGAGKSTLIQTVTGFVRPTAGSIRFGPHRLDGRSPDAIAAFGIARTFQTSRVFPALTVLDSVLIGTQRDLIGGGRSPSRFGAAAEPLAALLGLLSYRTRQEALRARAERVMRLFGDRLWSRRDDPAHSLSYANRRRLDIARALVSEPDILFRDEPTAGMNPIETTELAELLAQVHGHFPHMTIVMVEHKLDVIRSLSHRTVVMNQGRVIVDDTPDAALAHPDVATAYLGHGKGPHQIQSVTSGGGLTEIRGAQRLDPAIVVVEVDQVDVFYGPIQALFAVSLRVDPGEVVAVLGGNASGKSTTIKTVLRLVRPRSGVIRLLGRELRDEVCADVIDRGVASIPEGRRMFAELTVRDNLVMGAYARRGDRRLGLDEQLERVLDEFAWLKPRLHQLAGTLSGGEQQMVAMARAWLRRPLLLCIDEPSMGLSPLMVDRVYEILFRWKAQGLTILMVEQNANRALELADRAYVLRNGAVTLEGTAAALRADPAIQAAYLGAETGSRAIAPPRPDEPAERCGLA